MANQILGQHINSTLGNGGVTQPQSAELIISKLHKTYSINGNPNIVNKPNPSGLDERDINNTSTYRSTNGNRYIDNLPG
jgi:hypothetical protein